MLVESANVGLTPPPHGSRNRNGRRALLALGGVREARLDVIRMLMRSKMFMTHRVHWNRCERVKIHDPGLDGERMLLP